MTYDYRADENGVFEMHFLDWKTGERIHDVYITKLEPHQKLVCRLKTGYENQNEEEK